MAVKHLSTAAVHVELASLRICFKFSLIWILRVVTENFTARHLMLKALHRIQGQNSFAFIDPSLRTTSEVRGWEKTWKA